MKEISKEEYHDIMKDPINEDIRKTFQNAIHNYFTSTINNLMSLELHSMNENNDHRKIKQNS
jgi:DNA-binding cell septation regulator SpoVG